MIVNGELETTWKETAMLYFKVQHQYLPGGTKKISSIRMAGLHAKIQTQDP
jgi:hypothetical protein